MPTKFDSCYLPILMLLMTVTLVGCQFQFDIQDPEPEQGVRIVSGNWPPGLTSFLEDIPNFSQWRWDAPGESDKPGRVLLAVDDSGYRWTFLGPLPQREAPINLTPVDSTAWHSLHLEAAAACPQHWLPLPRVPVASAFYSDLLDLVTRLMPAGFYGLVTHWSLKPIPLTTMEAVSGAVDLQATLLEARDIINDLYGEPVFGPPDSTALGIRLVHLAGRVIRPACYMTFVRRDSLGAPLRMQLVIGDTYDDPWDRPYALRALLHELLHGLLLWEHSLDRNHLLWRNGTVANRPSVDEIAALRFWRALPGGLQIKRYGRRGELDP
jgi:hypothetical protein